jgi:hypothetical protein
MEQLEIIFKVLVVLTGTLSGVFLLAYGGMFGLYIFILVVFIAVLYVNFKEG